jgi:manganese oxidase
VSTNQGRRRFLKLAGLGASGLGVAAAFSRSGSIFGTNTVRAGGHNSPTGQAISWEEMDRLHSEGVAAFLDNVGKEPNYWRAPLGFEMDGDVKVFRLTASNIEWETGSGMTFPGMAYNGMIPGPEIRVTEGDRVRVILRNDMNQSTAIHFHGVDVPNDQDGVPFITQPAIQPGSEGIYEFDIVNTGTHMYHSHHNAAEQTTSGLLGAFIIEPRDRSVDPAYDAEYTMVLNDTALGFTINGKQFPFTQPIVASIGQRIRIRYMNEGLMIHPMHLHGLPQLVFNKDGFNLPAAYLCDTLNIAPGERYDVIVEASKPGVWAYHCHILNHAESAHGMFGMVTVLIVQEA